MLKNARDAKFDMNDYKTLNELLDKERNDLLVQADELYKEMQEAEKAGKPVPKYVKFLLEAVKREIWGIDGIQYHAIPAELLWKL